MCTIVRKSVKGVEDQRVGVSDVHTKFNCKSSLRHSFSYTQGIGYPAGVTWAMPYRTHQVGGQVADDTREVNTSMRELDLKINRSY